MNVGQNVAFPIFEHRQLPFQEVRRLVAEKLELVGLPGIEDKMPSELSGGMRKRVALARAIALDPDIMLFDEPTTGLDPIMTAAIDDLIIDTQKRFNMTCVVISHDIQSVFHIAHRIAMLYEGRIIEEGVPDAFRNSAIEIVQNFLSPLCR
jgi:phospholipid/cholesterol/gamma-HCH transport system ATP-binding protein